MTAPVLDRPVGNAVDIPDRPDRDNPAHEVWTWVERAQAGDTDAFGLIYDRYQDTVFRFIYSRTGNKPLAEDLTSDTFLRALKRINSFTWQGRDVGAWLVTIARNRTADYRKAGPGRFEQTFADIHNRADRVDTDPEGRPEDAVVDHITNVALLTAVKQLNPEQQECIVLRYLQQFSVAETAQLMGKNEGAIKALAYRAVRALAQALPEGFLLQRDDRPARRPSPPRSPVLARSGTALKQRAEQILSLRATGMSDRQIAHRIGYTNTDSVRGAVHVARRRGLVPPHEGNQR